MTLIANDKRVDRHKASIAWDINAIRCRVQVIECPYNKSVQKNPTANYFGANINIDLRDRGTQKTKVIFSNKDHDLLRLGHSILSTHFLQLNKYAK